MDLFNVSFRTSTLFERDSAKAEHLTQQKHVRNVKRGLTVAAVVPARSAKFVRFRVFIFLAIIF